MGNKVAIWVILVVAGGALAREARASTLVVDDDRVQCPTALYDSIQDAIDAAVSGDTIRVCAGTYAGPLAIDKRLNVRGARAGNDGRTRIVVPANESILTGQVGERVLILADGAIVDGFLMRMPFDLFDPGMETGPTTSGWRVQNNVFDDSGLVPHASGATQSVVRRNLFIKPYGSIPGGLSSDNAHNLLIQENRFVNADMIFAFSERLDVTGNSVTGDGSFQFVRSANLTIRNNKLRDVSKFAGIFLSRVSTALVHENRARGGISAYWIEGHNEDVTVTDNIAEECSGVGISLSWDGNFATGSTVEHNEVDSCNTGIRLYGADSNVIRFNDIEDNSVVGIEVQSFPVFAEAGNNLIEGNEVRGNGPPDCHDDSSGSGTAGTNNAWIENEGSRSIPIGLCVDHVDE